MTLGEKKWSALPMPFAMEVPDRMPEERYDGPDFRHTLNLNPLKRPSVEIEF
jgi:hypothetical protein